MSVPERRTIKAYAATKSGLEVEPFEYVSRPLGAEDVEIAISHCGICGSDLHTISGGWGGANFPVVPGHEIVGTITATGSSVTSHKVGDRVGVGAMVFSCQHKDTCKQCASEKDSYCPQRVMTYGSKYADGEKAYGGYAEFVRVSSHYAFKIPEAIPSDVAAPLLCAGVTVYVPLHKYVKPGDRVGVVGIGGLGHLGLQFAKALGGTPVAFSQSPNKEQAARELGAEDFVVCSDPEAVAKAKRSVDVLLVTADAENQPWDTYIRFIAVGGTLILVGLPNDKIQFSPHSLIGGNVTIVGSLIGGIKDTVDMLKLAAEKGVRPVIQKLHMSDANEGIAMVDQGKVRYRVVLQNARL
jgi:alcohol dehydrogenase (NADP+)